MLISSITLNGFLSFGVSSETIDLQPLNVIIGANGSGKSNFLEAFELLRNAPEHLLKPIREGGGIGDWLWKGSDSDATASLNLVVANEHDPQQALRYVLSFTGAGHQFEIVDEKVEFAKPKPGHQRPYLFYHFNEGRPVLNIMGAGVKETGRLLQPEDVDRDKSILAQRKDSDHYPEVTRLGQTLSKIRLYREWSFGRYTAPRSPQKADLPNNMLEPDGSNLGLVLNRLRRNPDVKEQLLSALRELYAGIDDYDVQIEGGTVQVFLQENRTIDPSHAVV